MMMNVSAKKPVDAEVGERSPIYFWFRVYDHRIRQSRWRRVFGVHWFERASGGLNRL